VTECTPLQTESTFLATGTSEESVSDSEKNQINSRSLLLSDNQDALSKNTDNWLKFKFNTFFNSDFIINFNYMGKLNDYFVNLRHYLTSVIFSLFDGEVAQLGLALSLGSYSVNLDAQMKSRIRSVGLTHMTAVSGFHLAIFYAFLDYLLLFFFTRRMARWWFFILIPGYILLVGSPPSVVRAGIMLVFSLMARYFFYKPYLPVYSLFLCFILMSIYQVTILSNVGFQLSFLATAGILLLAGEFDFSPLDESRELGNKRPTAITNSIKGLFFVSLAAQLAVLPVLINVFGEYALTSLFSTIIFGVLISLIVVLMVGLIFLILFFSGVELLTEWLILPYSWSLEQVLNFFHRLFIWYSDNFSQMLVIKFKFNWWQFCLYYGVLGLMVFGLTKKRKKRYVYI
jgi:ComEC/Rec2-related protein